MNSPPNGTEEMSTKLVTDEEEAKRSFSDYFPREYDIDRDENKLRRYRVSLSFEIYKNMMDNWMLISRFTTIPCIILGVFICNLIMGNDWSDYTTAVLDFTTMVVLMRKMFRYPTNEWSRNLDLLDELREIFIYGVTIYLKAKDGDYLNSIYSAIILSELSMLSIIMKSYHNAKIDYSSIFVINFREYSQNLETRYYILRSTLLLVSFSEVIAIYLNSSTDTIVIFSLVRHILMLLCAIMI